ncbi:DUF4817 domain-containing protein [Trichonephila inaurata madagascariensis]|uniref:DUF4817 domain-containing protein n=1 Tax=Trichonephila inaurata madagascariensis TaxID=2747483 RepID=A0A8X6WT59_9ARAC|nr:DUF4817 domain-containing protein [Trichonephila inaurata madagascariensis]
MANIHFIYCVADGNALEAQRLYGERFPSRRLPNRKNFERLHRCLRETGSFVSGMHDTLHKTSARTPELEEHVLREFERQLETSTWTVSVAANISHMTDILALVPKLHAPSDASDESDPECELDDNSTHYSSSPAPSLVSITDLNISIYGPDSEDEQNARVSHGVTDEPDINLNSSVNYVFHLPQSCKKLTQVTMRTCHQTLSAIAFFPNTAVTPATPITPDIASRKKNTRKSRKTRSKKTNLPPAKRAKKTKRFQLTYNWKRASLSHSVTE